MVVEHVLTQLNDLMILMDERGRSIQGNSYALWIHEWNELREGLYACYEALESERDNMDDSNKSNKEEEMYYAALNAMYIKHPHQNLRTVGLIALSSFTASRALKHAALTRAMRDYKAGTNMLYKGHFEVWRGIHSSVINSKLGA